MSSATQVKQIKNINYENLYNSLKKEYDQIKQDNDDIFSEYEQTIQMLSTSLTDIKSQKEELEKKVKLLETEKEKLQNKNQDKLIDIQNLNKINDKLNVEIKKYREEKQLKDSKIVRLEKDNDHYQNKIRQYEAIIVDLNEQIENTLEENITLQTEYELYKQTTKEELIRREEELKDYKNDITNKDKIIQRINKKNIMKNIQNKLKLGRSSFEKLQRKLTSSFQKDDVEENDKKLTTTDQKEIFLKKTTTLCDNNNNIHVNKNLLITPVIGETKPLPTKFEQIYKSSLKNVNYFCTTKKIRDFIKNDEAFKIKTPLKKTTANKKVTKFAVERESNKNIKNIKNNKNTKSNTKLINNKINDNDKIIEDKLELDFNGSKKEILNSEDNNSSSDECLKPDKLTDSSDFEKVFEDLVICDEKDFSIINLKKLIGDSDKGSEKDKSLKDCLHKLLLLTQQKRNNLLNKRKIMQQKLEKLGFRFRI